MIAAILAGGRNARMGADKSWLDFNGCPMIEHVLAAAQSVAEQLAIVIHSENPELTRYKQLAARWKAKLLFDLHDYRGPLGGIETILQQSGEKTDALILACDLPFMTAEFLQLLRKIHEVEKNELTVPLDQQGRPQMLAAIYAAQCQPMVSTLLSANELKVQLLQERVATRRVSWAEYAHLPKAEQLFININTPDMLAQAASRKERTPNDSPSALD
jgi:molybdenum cofactor guanylyltransferase